MMNTKMTVAIAAGLLAAACSNEGAPTEAADVETTTAADADDDTLEPEAPKVEEGEEHNEDAPHSH
jgi:ABC-type glycerol-3-phosphate transport system substrate-binding protein